MSLSSQEAGSSEAGSSFGLSAKSARPIFRETRQSGGARENRPPQNRPPQNRPRLDGRFFSRGRRVLSRVELGARVSANSASARSARTSAAFAASSAGYLSFAELRLSLAFARIGRWSEQFGLQRGFLGGAALQPDIQQRVEAGFAASIRRAVPAPAMLESPWRKTSTCHRSSVGKSPPAAQNSAWRLE